MTTLYWKKVFFFFFNAYHINIHVILHFIRHYTVRFFGFFRFLDAYHTHNLTFWALTTGNEPINGYSPCITINSMGWSPTLQRDWISGHLGPQLKSSKHNATLLFAVDDQRYVVPWWLETVKIKSLSC